MGLFDRYKKKAEDIAKGVWAQVNVRDGGKTYDTVSNNKQVGYRQQPQQATPSRMSVGVARPQPQVRVQPVRQAPQRVSVQQPPRRIPTVNIAAPLRTPALTIGNVRATQSPTMTNKAGQYYRPKDTAFDTAVAVSAGTGRNVTNTAQGVSGLVDLVTPGKGTSRVTKYLNNSAEGYDRFVKQNDLNEWAYKAGQVGTEIATFMLPGGLASKAATKAGTIASKVPSVQKTAYAVDKIARNGNRAQKFVANTVKYAAKPQNAIDIAVDTALSAGHRGAREQDVSAGTVALDAGMSLGFGRGLDIAGKGLQKGWQKVAPGVERATRGSDGGKVPLYTHYGVITKPNGKMKLVQDPGQVNANIKNNIRALADDFVQFNRRLRKDQGGFVRNPLVNPDGTPRIGKYKNDPAAALKQEALKYDNYDDYMAHMHATYFDSAADKAKSAALLKTLNDGGYANGRELWEAAHTQPTPKVEAPQPTVAPVQKPKPWERGSDAWNKALKNVSDYWDTAGGKKTAREYGITKADVVAYRASNAPKPISNDAIPAPVQKPNPTVAKPVQPIFTEKLKPVQKPKTTNPTVQAIEEAGAKVGVPKKLKTVYDADKKLNQIRKNKKEIIEAQAAEIMMDARGDLYSKVLKEGGISSSAYEDLPKYVIRKDGLSADRAAQVLGYKDEGALIEALNRPKYTKGQAEAEAEQLLSSGTSLYSKDYQAVLQAEKARVDELAINYPVTARPIDKPNAKMTDPEWQSLAATATTRPKTTKQAVGLELATVRKEAQATKQIMDELQARQRNEVIQGNFDTAAKMRLENEATYKKLKDLNARERELAKKYATESGTPSVKPEVAEKQLEALLNPSLKDKQVKANFRNMTSEYLGDVEAAKITADKKALEFRNTHKLTSEQNIEVIRAADDPTYKVKDSSVKKAVSDIHDTYDKLFKYFTQEKGVDMGYQHDYYPRDYVNTKTGDSITAAEYNLLQKMSGRQKGRTSDTLADWKLKTTDPAEAIKTYYNNLERAAAGRKYIQQLEQSGLVVKSHGEPVRGMRPIIAEGLQASDGSIYYAKKNIANKLNHLFGSREASNLVEQILEKGAGLNSLWQSVVMSGGVPNSPINAFGFMQVMKEAMALHPVKAAKAFYSGMNKDFAQKYFTKKSDTMALMAKQGISTRYSLNDGAKKGMGRVKEAFTDSKAKGINQAWNEITNDATFSRFMSYLQVEHFDKVYKHGIKKGLAPEKAAKIAGESTKNFYGITDMYKTSTRAKAADDAAGAILFAPRFRESMVNFWVKNAKAFGISDKKWNMLKPEYRDNAKFLASAAVMYTGYDLLNKELNGTHLWENPENKEDKLLIPNATSDGKTIGIPFLPSIATVPRNLAQGAYNLATGDFEGAGKNATSFLSMPLRTIGEVLTNENYFGTPIVDRDASAPEKLTQGAAHVAKSTMQPWVREGLNAFGQGLPDSVKKPLGIKQKSAFETASNALEAPLRFYDPKYMRGAGDNFKTPTGQTVGELKATEGMGFEEAAKLRFSSKEGQAFLRLKNDKEREAADPELFRQYKGLKQAFEYSKDKGKPDNYSSLSKDAKKFYDIQGSLTDEGKEKWLKRSTDARIKPMYDAFNANRVKNTPDLPQTNEVAKMIAEYESKKQKGNWSAVRDNAEKLAVYRNAYKTVLDDTDKYLLAANDKELEAAINAGEVSQEQMDRLIAIDDLMVSLKGSAQISKTMRSKLGYSSKSTSGKSSGSRSSGSSSKASKKVNMPTPNFVSLGSGNIVSTKAPLVKYAAVKKPTYNTQTRKAKARIKSL